MSVLFSTQEAFSQASTVQTLATSVQTAVAVEKLTSPSPGTINPENGEISGSLTSSFKLKSNDENSYEFVMYSSIQTSDKTVSAFDVNGNLLFANTRFLPLSSAVENARNNVAGNANVIGYPFKVTLDDNMTINFTTDQDYNECYKINFKTGAATGNMVQTVTGSPTLNTYGGYEDLSGTYRATVYITAIAK